MLELIKELLEREWQFEMCNGYDSLNSDHELDYHLHMYLGNTERRIYGDEQARLLLEEIRIYW